MASSNGNQGSSTLLLDVVCQFFADENWPYVHPDGKSFVRVNFQGKHGSWACIAQTIEDKNLFVFYSICPVTVPAARHPEAVEFLTRVNYGLWLGNFEFDYTDGEVRFKTSLNVENDRLSTALINNIVYFNAGMLDRYLPGLLSVIYGEKSPADAVSEIEG